MISDCFHRAKVFGVGIDASDDPWTMQLKLAAVYARENGVHDPCLDPYDAIVPELARFSKNLEHIGKVPVPSWLNPIPQASDAALVKKENMERYVAAGGMLDLTLQVKDFVKKQIFPGLPVMLGVDHSATGGVVSALAEELGPENMSVVVLDQHFDGLPLFLRLEPQIMEHFSQTNPFARTVDDNEYCCGNFWKHLIDSGVVMPENLLFVGVADYPSTKAVPGGDNFRDNYLSFEARGCRFFPLKEFEGSYRKKLKKYIEDTITTPYVYVSLDVDVGAYNCVHAARYMDSIGIDRKALMDVAHLVGGHCRSGKTRLAGMDIMEFNMHFLGLKTEQGKKDRTLSVALDFLKELLQLQEEENNKNSCSKRSAK
jgi:arginase family enzyme